MQRERFAAQARVFEVGLERAKSLLGEGLSR